MKSRVTERLAEGPAQEIVDCLYAPEINADFAPMFPYMTAVNKAHVLMLARQAVITKPAARKLLRAILALERRGPESVALDRSLEDIYFNYERAVIALAGPEIGGQMHTGRSRNDLNATLARLRTRDLVLKFLASLFEARRAALAQAKRCADVVMSGYTHLQPAQPTTFGHYLLGVAAALERDTDRVTGGYPVTNRCPLGAAAMTGTTFPIDRAYTCRLLGFDGLVEHTQDAVASRDFALQLLAAWAVFGLTCSRLAQDFHVWFTPELGLIDFPDRVAGTSSIMPQKKNPVVLEHLKGKASALVAGFAWAASSVKNTHFTNVIDANHECADALWRATNVAETCTVLLRLSLSTVLPRASLMLERARQNFCTATDLADACVRHGGMPFRQAHHVVGAVVREAIRRGLSSDRIGSRLVDEVARKVLGRPAGLAESVVKQALDPVRSVRARNTIGGPGPRQVRRMAREGERRLASEERAHAARKAKLARARRGLDEAVKALLGA
ncbi:MAG TPA: argininosuccinate lyase [bacterium]|nr:argininosuccinate lyase [bacterium]